MRGGICAPNPLFYHEFKNQNTNTALNFCGLRVPANGSDQNDMKTEGANNHRVRLNCHMFAMYNERSQNSENSLQELEEDIERTKSGILGLYEVSRKNEVNIDFVSGHVQFYKGSEDERILNRIFDL